MIGARDMAFPRLNALSYWMFLFGGLVLYASVFFSPPEAGWTCYVPLSLTAVLPHGGHDAWIYMVHLTGLSSLLGAINFFATIANMRAPGMGWGRMPLFVWTILIYAYLLILALPSLAADGDDAAASTATSGRTSSTRTQGGSPLLWQHLFWFFGHPEVYILVLPAFGIFSEVLPVFARKPIFGYKAIAAATAGIAFLGHARVGAPHVRDADVDRRAGVLHALSFLIAVPTGVKIFNWIATLWRGTVEWTTPLLYCVGGIFTFTIGGITGIFLAVFPIDWQLTDTYFVVAHFHYMAFGGAAFAMFARALLLVPEDDRAGCSTRRWARSASRFTVHRLPPDLPDPALGRPVRACRGASTSTPTPSWTAYNFISTVGAFIHRPRRADDDRQRRAVAQERRDRRPGPVEGEHARVVHALAAAGEQLRRHPARALGRADEGHPPRDRAAHRRRASATAPASRCSEV